MKNGFRGSHFFAACLAAAITAASGAAAGAAASGYPERPIRLVLPFPPGGGTDTLARIMTPKLSESMGQQWVVDNRSGAGGNIATEIVAKAAPDGYTLLMGFSTALTVNPTLYKKLPFDVLRDLQPVTKLADAQYILVVHPSVPARTLKEFIQYAKERPGKLNYSSSGVGSPLHLAAELFKQRAGINIVHVPYKGGGPAAAAVLAGEVQILFGSVASTVPQIKAGKLRALAVTGLKRSPVLPDLPTIAESGFPGFSVTSWYALLVPAKTPAKIVNRLHDEAVKALQYPEVRKGMARQGLEMETSTPAELEKEIRSETAMWAKLIKAVGIHAD